MHKVVITDTSILVVLNKIGALDILHLVYGNLFTTSEVADEYGDPIPDWIVIKPVSDLKYQHFLETLIDKGEASAIALAMETEDPLLLLDDLKARKIAQKLHLHYTGTLGIIKKAKDLGIIEEVRPMIEKLLQTDFRIADHIIKEFLTLSGEMD